MESRALLVLSQPPHPWRPKHSRSLSLFPNPNPLLLPSSSSHLRLRSYSTSYRRWDSNAETIRSKTFGFNFRDKQDDTEYDDEEEEDEDHDYRKKKKKKRRWWSDEPFEEESFGGVVEEAIDSIWIFKVFKSYGWALPFIITSLLLPTGPKAFLMALALPLGQSALSLAFEKVWGRTQTRRKRKSRMRRKPSATTGANVKKDEEEAYDEDQETNKKVNYQSWVVGNDVSDDKSGKDTSSLGGWDDLERMESKKRQFQSKPRGKSKLSRRERSDDTPLLLRLLIAVFPFLSSWTKIFW